MFFNFGFYKIQRQTKAVLAEILRNFFSNMVKTYQIMMPDIVENQNNSDLEKIFISPDFPYAEKKLPLIIITIKDVKEKKMYMGADNVIGYRLLGTSTGQKTVEVYGGAATLSINLTIVALSSEDRMRLAELLNICFTHFYRWQYFYTYNDGDQFSIVPNNDTISVTGESEINDQSKTSLLYVVNMTMNSFVEYTFTGLEMTGKVLHYEIDENSGPIVETSTGSVAISGSYYTNISV